MVSGMWKRMLASVLVSVLSLVGATWGTAVAGVVDPCSTTTNPFVVSLDAPLTEAKPNAQMEIKVTVSNCTAAEWSGSVDVAVTSWVGPWCVPDDSFPAQPVTIRARDTRTLRFQGLQPLCPGNYTATATAYDTVDRATGSDIFGLYTKTKPIRNRA